jgi:hypothetical protein
MDLGYWRFGFIAEIQQSYAFDIFFTEVCLDLIKAFRYTNSQGCVYIYGLLISTFSSLAEISGLYCIGSVAYLEIDSVKIFSVDYGLLDFVTVVLYVARGITEMSAACCSSHQYAVHYIYSTKFCRKCV